MKRETVTRIARQVVRTFPEMEGVTPTVRTQESNRDADVFLLTFKGRAALPGGKTISRIVRVVADDSGRIIRISTSR